MIKIYQRALLTAACLGALSSGALAQSQKYGDWFVTRSTDGSGDMIAATSIDNGTQFIAVRCFVSSQKCMHALVTESKCVESSKYPLLLNAPSGAALIEGLCSVNNGKYELFLSPFDTIRKALNGTGMIGFAIPMESGAFKALRFSLSGSVEAMKKAEGLLPTSSAPRTGSSAF